MDALIVDMLGALSGQFARPAWAIKCDREVLLDTLREAASRAEKLNRGVVATVVQPVEWCDALHIFGGSREAGLGDCFYWERPVEHSALVGIGVAAALETAGATCFSDAAESRRTLLKDAVLHQAPGNLPERGIGPILLGGFAFDPLHMRTPLWDGFPEGLLVLPHLLLTCWGEAQSSARCSALTINTLVTASDDLERRADEIALRVVRLRAAVEHAWQEEKAGMAALPAVSCLLPVELRSPAEWRALVADTVEAIRRGDYEKVVLARGVQVTAEPGTGNFDLSVALSRLRQSYPSAYLFAIGRGERYFVGATPERLVCAQEGQVQTVALAGSAPRGTNGAEDARLGAELLDSAKNKSEHAIVVQTVYEALSRICTSVRVEETPRLLKLKNVQHLETPISGELRPGCCILEAIAALHPTPAVGGFPRQAALEAIRDYEGLDRGWYAGPVGWIDASGGGEFAVALRSALIVGQQATLFAGCGIVAGSNPESEYAESHLKLQVMLRALGGDE